MKPSAVSGIIAIVLLGFYTYAIVILLQHPDAQPADAVGQVLNIVGALVSALVVAVLAITPPQKTFESLGRTFASAGPSIVVGLIATCYLLVWLGCGILLVVVWMRTPVPADALNAAARSWLGIAVAAAYAYLGLKPA